jgi:hypothetical protein
MCFLFAVAAKTVSAATLEAVVDKTSLSLDDTVTLQLVFAGAGLSPDRPELPSLSGFQARYGGQSQNISYVNGNVSSQVTYTYILQPQSPGTFIIPAVTAVVDGQTLATQPITLHVGRSASAGPAPTPAERSGGRDLFVTGQVDNTSPYVGQPVTFTFRFYQRINLPEPPSYAPPAATGFSAQPLDSQKQSRQTVNGVPYAVSEIKTLLFPLTPGKAVIGPASLECRAPVPGGGAFGGLPSFFDDFFATVRPVTLRTNPIAMNVRSLPDEGRPASFRGDVGRYTLAAALDKTAGALREPVTLTVTLAGEGNVKAITEPERPPLVGFRAYDTVASFTASGPARGTKTFKTVLKPEVSGRLTAPPIRFSFFDPAARSYRTVETPPLTYTAAPGEPGAESPGAPAPAGETVTVMTEDIRHIKPVGPLSPRRTETRGPLFWVLLNLVPVLLFSLAAALRWLGKLGKVARPPSSKLALGRALKQISRSQPLLARGDLPAYYAALQRITDNFFSSLTGRPAAGLTRDDLMALLRERSSPSDLTDGITGLQDDLDRARYAPGTLTAEEARRTQEVLRRTLTAMESLWKK